MYSPKINEELVPKLYRLGKAYKKPMTKVVDEILKEYLSKIEIKEELSIKNEINATLVKTYEVVKNGN